MGDRYSFVKFLANLTYFTISCKYIKFSSYTLKPIPVLPVSVAGLFLCGAGRPCKQTYTGPPSGPFLTSVISPSEWSSVCLSHSQGLSQKHNKNINNITTNITKMEGETCTESVFYLKFYSCIIYCLNGKS